MTRFKEQSRIEAAIDHRNRSELLWAEEYCRMRLAIAPRKDHEKYWKNMGRRVVAALAVIQTKSAILITVDKSPYHK
jgi:hypothetical protein